MLPRQLQARCNKFLVLPGSLCPSAISAERRSSACCIGASYPPPSSARSVPRHRPSKGPRSHTTPEASPFHCLAFECLPPQPGVVSALPISSVASSAESTPAASRRGSMLNNRLAHGLMPLATRHDPQGRRCSSRVASLVTKPGKRGAVWRAPISVDGAPHSYPSALRLCHDLFAKRRHAVSSYVRDNPGCPAPLSRGRL